VEGRRRRTSSELRVLPSSNAACSTSTSDDAAENDDAPSFRSRCKKLVLLRGKEVPGATVAAVDSTPTVAATDRIRRRTRPRDTKEEAHGSLRRRLLLLRTEYEEADHPIRTCLIRRVRTRRAWDHLRSLGIRSCCLRRVVVLLLLRSKDQVGNVPCRRRDEVVVEAHSPAGTVAGTKTAATGTWDHLQPSRRRRRGYRRCCLLLWSETENSRPEQGRLRRTAAIRRRRRRQTQKMPPPMEAYRLRASMPVPPLDSPCLSQLAFAC